MRQRETYELTRIISIIVVSGNKPKIGLNISPMRWEWLRWNDLEGERAKGHETKCILLTHWLRNGIKKRMDALEKQRTPPISLGLKSDQVHEKRSRLFNNNMREVR